MICVEIIGWVITVIAVSGAILNNRRNRVCFGLWCVSNALSAGVHVAAGMYALSARDAVFFVLAIQGFVSWGRANANKTSIMKLTT